ncbi:serine palmitoyltransferase small subunit A [Schistocerca americana]|uniref:serine palmitoyltransferase small subunit A n=1 Tax=Schistocerca americana TaxID=7009 RepID=UPI001F502BEE|nr:serine palmitoyltransferase small subunit A [Schistocerca americana]XP_049961033.1 serine palmitoyltransferase small subunit A [Schistocerca serialis cubense]
MLEKIWKLLSYWYLQYELVTCMYVFEPWEKKLLNGMIVLIVALICYSSYVYLPHYTMSLLAHFRIFDSSSLGVDYHYTSNRDR